MTVEALFELEATEPIVLPHHQQWTAGSAALGYGGIPSTYRTTPELCPVFFHPPVTYNPWCARTWCLCGRKTYAGDMTSTPHLACCDGALTTPSQDFRSEGEDQ